MAFRQIEKLRSIFKPKLKQTEKKQALSEKEKERQRIIDEYKQSDEFENDVIAIVQENVGTWFNQNYNTEVTESQPTANLQNENDIDSLMDEK